MGPLLRPQRLKSLTGARTFGFVTSGALGGMSTRFGIQPPVTGLLGFGGRWQLSRHLAVRPEVQVPVVVVFPIGARFIVGLSAP